MAAGRCSSNPTDLLLVDPSQPEATKRTRKHLTKRQRSKMLKAEKKEEEEGKTPTGLHAASPEEQSTPQPSTSKE